MAIYGIGAYLSNVDVSNIFITNNIIGTDWDNIDAPELHEYIKSLKVGDIVYIKSANFGNDITVKGVGVISDNTILNSSSNSTIQIGRNVRWIDTTRFVITKPAERNNVRSNTIYEEFHPAVQAQIISRII